MAENCIHRSNGHQIVTLDTPTCGHHRHQRKSIVLHAMWPHQPHTFQWVDTNVAILPRIFIAFRPARHYFGEIKFMSLARLKHL